MCRMSGFPDTRSPSRQGRRRHGAGVSPLDRLIAAVRRRTLVAEAAARAARWWWWCGGVFIIAVVAGRLTGVGAGWLVPAATAIPLTAAAAAALALSRPIGRRACARRIDRTLGGGDLALTACDLPRPGTGMTAVTVARADAAALTLAATAVVPWQPWRRAGAASGLLAVAVAAAAWLPQADPFGVARRTRIAGERQRAAAEAQARAIATAAEIRARQPDAALSAATQAALGELLTALAPKPGQDQAARLAALDAERRSLSSALDAAADRESAKTGEDGMQRVGGAADPAATAALRQALERGDAGPARQAVESAVRAAERAAQATDPAERAAAERDLRQRLSELAQAAKRSPAAARALADALERLADAADPATARAAMDALAADLGQADAAMSELAQGARDRQALKDALDAARLARAAAAAGRDRNAHAQDSLEAYKRMYEDLLAQGGGTEAGEEDGPGMGDKPGRGRGGKAPENPDAETGSVSERSRSRDTPGKIVASWAAPGASEPGTVVQAYQEQLQAARREAADQVLSEDLPAAYRDAAKRYFDDLAHGTQQSP